jgi:hypothetical protein
MSLVQAKMFNIKMAPKWCFDVDIDRSVDKVDPKIRCRREPKQ